MAPWDGSLWLVIKEQGNDTVQMASATGNPTGSTWSGWSAVPGNGHTAHGPTVAGVSPGELCLGMTGQTSTTLYQQCYIQGLGWLGWNASDFSGVGPASRPRSTLTGSHNPLWGRRLPRKP